MDTASNIKDEHSSNDADENRFTYVVPFQGKTPVRWLPEEDDRLKFALSLQQQSVNPNWKDVSIAVGTKTATQCSRRWKRALQPDLKKGRWSREEDEALKTLVQEVNFQWREIARLMPGRSSKQCRERWSNYLNPNLRRGPWSLKEDEIILQTHAQIGNRWSELSHLLPGRTENSVKLRWKSLTRRKKNPESEYPDLAQLEEVFDNDIDESISTILTNIESDESETWMNGKRQREEAYVEYIGTELKEKFQVVDCIENSDTSTSTSKHFKRNRLTDEDVNQLKKSPSLAWVDNLNLLDESKNTIESWSSSEVDIKNFDVHIKNTVGKSNSFICALYETPMQCWAQGDYMYIGQIRRED